MRLIAPPTPQAARKAPAPEVVPATRAGVRKMPMPTTRLTTIMAVSNVESLASRPEDGASAATERLGEQRRQRPILLVVVVGLGGNAHQLPSRAGPGEKPALDPALARPSGEQVPAQTRDRGIRSRGRERERGHRADHALRARRRDLQRLAENAPPFEGEGVIALHERRPAAGQEAAEDAQTLGDRQIRGRVECPGPIPLLAE